MAMSISQLTTEIKQIISDGIDAGRVMPAHWIVHTVLRKHPIVYDQDKVGTSRCDSDYAELARHELARQHVRRVLRLFKNPEPELPTLPGFCRLLKAYSTTREDDFFTTDDDDDDEELNATIVPVEQMTDDELLARADYYDAMSDGCREHARELRRYVQDRRTKRTGAA